MTNFLNNASRFFLSFSLLAVFCSGSSSLADDALPINIKVEASIICDRCTLLNAMSEETAFNKNFESERKELLPALTKTEQLKSDLQQLAGSGVALAYFMNGSSSKLELFRADISKWQADSSKDCHEPAYKNDLDYFVKHQKEILAYTDALKEFGFDKWWQNKCLPKLEPVIDAIEQSLNSKLSSDCIAYVNQFIGTSSPVLKVKELPRVFVGYFNKPYSFNLSGGQACFSSDLTPDEAPSMLLHEWLHSFNPSNHVVELHKAISGRDPFYAAAAKQIYDDGKEGEEEEFVVAAEKYSSVCTGVSTMKTALRGLKNSYGGMPLAAILFDRLYAKYPDGLPAKFDYNAFLEEAFKDNVFKGPLQAEFNKIVAPVSGKLGLVLGRVRDSVVVSKVFPTTSAAEVGLAEGDLIESVNGTSCKSLTLAAVIDLISGPPGFSFDLGVVRKGEFKKVHVSLK
jgi:hypothetical protein